MGPWGQQKSHRHGHQPGYVIYAGRKVTLERPRLRSQEDQEVPLASYQAFQKDGKLQQAVARQLTRQCSTRTTREPLIVASRAMDQALQCQSPLESGDRSGVGSAHATSDPQRFVGADDDSKFFGGDCLVAAIGIDVQGRSTFWHLAWATEIQPSLKACWRIWSHRPGE